MGTKEVTQLQTQKVAMVIFEKKENIIWFGLLYSA
jgi:hypothetical protein